MQKGKYEEGRGMSEHLQRCHVIEGMVQLLTNGLVLQLLSIQFIWRSEVDRKCREVKRTATTQRSQKQSRNERQREVKRRGRKERTNKNGSVFLSCRNAWKKERCTSQL